MKLIKNLIACTVALACVAVPINNYTAYNDAIAVGEEAETPIWDGTEDTSWYDDDETEFHLYTAEELAGFSKLIKNKKDMTGKTIYLENDIVLNDVSNFDNWGEEPPENEWSSDLDFNGTFEGNGNTITGLYGKSFINNLKENGIVNNLNIDTSYAAKGGICCEVYGVVSNCSYGGLVHSEAYSRYISEYYYQTSSCAAGGICQTLKSGGTIKNCKNSAIITSLADASSAKNYRSSVRVSGDDVVFARSGGICGYCSGGNIMNCYNNSDNITAEALGSYGIIGCLSISSRDYAGAICGDGPSNIENCYNLGKGISIRERYKFDHTTITNTYNVGGNISSDSYQMSNCYYLSGSADSDGGGAKAKSKLNMQSKAFAESLGNAFVYVEGDYPKLFWELGYPDPNAPEEPTTEPAPTEPLPVEINKDLIICNKTGIYDSIYVKNTSEDIQFKSADTDIVEVTDNTVHIVGRGTTVVYAYDSNKNYYECLVVFEGDINVDGKTNIADAVFLQDYLLGDENFADSKQYRIADIDQDGKTDVFDMILMRKLIVS